MWHLNSAVLKESVPLWSRIGLILSLFILFPYVLGISKDIKLGGNAQIANEALNSVRFSMLAIKKPALQLQVDGNSANIISKLENLSNLTHSHIKHFESVTAYNTAIGAMIKDFRAAFNLSLNAEMRYLVHLTEPYNTSNIHQINHEHAILAAKNQIMSLQSFQLLTDIDVLIHDDIKKGLAASYLFQLTAASLFISFFLVIIVYQRNSKRKHVIREKNLEMTLKSIGNAVIATDIHGCITCMNPEAERLTGWLFSDAKSCMLSEVFKVVNAHNGIPIEHLVERVTKGNGIVVLAEDSMLIASNGDHYQIYENGAPIYDDANKIIGVVLVFRDITQEIELKNCLDENVLRLQRVIDSSMDAVIVTDEQYMLKEWNPAAENMFGWAYAEIVSQPIYKIIVPEEFHKYHRQGDNQIDQDSKSAFIAKRIESSALHRDGHTFPVELSVISVPTEKGWVFNVFVRDLSEREDSQDLIKKKNILLNGAQSVANLGCWENDLSNGRVWWSDDLYKILGLDSTRQDASLKLYMKHVHPDDRKHVKEIFKKSLEEKQAYDIVHRAITSTGIKYLNGKGETSFDEKGGAVRQLGIIQDVTEQVENEKLLKKKEALFLEAQGLAKQGYWELDLANNKLEWSDEVYKIYDLDLAVTKPSYELFISKVHPEDKERVSAAYKESLENKTPYNVIYRIVTSNGLKVVHERCKTIYADDGRPVQSLGLVHDITAYRRAVGNLQDTCEVVESSPVVLFRWKPTENLPVEFVTENVKQFGYNAAELISGFIPFSEIVHPEDLPRVAQEVEEYSNAGVDQFSQEYRIVSPTGEIYYIDNRTTIERNTDGTVKRYQGIVLDITERVSKTHTLLNRFIY